MFQQGDCVERDIDGLFFEAHVKVVHPPPPRNPDSRGQRRSYTYDLLYPDTKNTEQRVPEDEIRLKVGRRRASGRSGSKSEEDPSLHSSQKNRLYRRPGSDNSISTVAPAKGAFVLVGEQEHDGVPHTTATNTTNAMDEGKRNDPNRHHATSCSPSASPNLLHSNPFAATSDEQEHQKKSGKINVHNMDDNERFQSTGSAYITHGHVGQHTKKGAGGGGLRAIRMLRK
jgi:hypothetical protein